MSTDARDLVVVLAFRIGRGVVVALAAGAEETRALEVAGDEADPATLSFALEDLSKTGARLILCLDEVEELTKRRA